MGFMVDKQFVDGGRTVVHGLRRALAEILFSVESDPSEPQEISRRFGLDKTLTWRIARVVREEDAWEAISHIPRRPSMQIFLTAMSKHGAPAERVEAVWQAFNSFDRFIEVHSGDRETLEMMASATSRPEAMKRQEAFRKDGFQANSAILGVRAQTQLAIHFMAPSDIAGLLDFATICGYVGFRRLRADVVWSVATQMSWDMNSPGQASHQSVSSEPLETEITRDAIPLLSRFGTSPAPEMRQVRESENARRYMLAEGPVGNTAAATVYMGWLNRRLAPMSQSYPGESGEHGAVLSTPVEELVHDLFIHRDLVFAMEVTARVVSRMPGGPSGTAEDPRSGLVLPVPFDVVDSGFEMPDATSPPIPHYRDMAEFAAGRLGHSARDFRIFRYRLRYPPIPSLSLLRHPLQAR